jgi:hypothetical protein
MFSRASGALDKIRNKLGGHSVPPAPPPPPGEEDEDDDGMLRMSFMDHLAELRTRLLRMVYGIVIAAIACVSFSKPLWEFVSKPATEALKALGKNPDLVQTKPMEAFNIVYFKMPLMCAIFVASPWILYQVWGFISPGLYRRERRWLRSSSSRPDCSSSAAASAYLHSATPDVPKASARRFRSARSFRPRALTCS